MILIAGAHKDIYNEQYHDKWAWSLAIKGAKQADIARAFGVSRNTITQWMYRTDSTGNKILTSFGEAVQMGREAADAAVEKKLFERCMGLTVKEKQQVIDVNKDGSSRIGQIRTYEKEIPPDTTAIMYWLNNRKKNTGEWSQRQEVNVKLGDENDGVMIYIPDNGRDDNAQH